MFWNDIKEIKEWMVTISARLTEMQMKHLENKDSEKDLLEEIKTTFDDTFCSEDECSSFNRIHDKLDLLINDAKRVKQVDIAEKILDKFEDYMKNVDKLNAMINEFKGCVAMSRATLSEFKKAKNDEPSSYFP
jgi:hypothetical protein